VSPSEKKWGSAEWTRESAVEDDVKGPIYSDAHNFVVRVSCWCTVEGQRVGKVNVAPLPGTFVVDDTQGPTLEGIRFDHEFEYVVPKGVIPDIHLAFHKDRESIVDRDSSIDSCWKVFHILSTCDNLDNFEKKTQAAKICADTGLGRWLTGQLMEMPSGSNDLYTVGFSDDQLDERSLAFDFASLFDRDVSSIEMKKNQRDRRSFVVNGINKCQLRGRHAVYLFPSFLRSFEENISFCEESEFHTADENKSPPEGRIVECLVPTALIPSRWGDEGVVKWGTKDLQLGSIKTKTTTKELFESYQNILYQDASKRTILSIIVLFFLLQSTLVQTACEVFNCEELSDGKRYLSVHLDTECYKGEHLFISLVFAVPTLFTVVFALPAVLFFILWFNKKSLHSVDMKLAYGFLYAGFEDEYYYWEILGIVRKNIFIMISASYGSDGSSLQLLLILGVTVVSYIFHISAYPYIDIKMDRLEKCSLGVNLLTAWGALVIHMKIVVDTAVVATVAANCVVILVLISNIVVISLRKLRTSKFFRHQKEEEKYSAKKTHGRHQAMIRRKSIIIHKPSGH